MSTLNSCHPRSTSLKLAVAWYPTSVEGEGSCSQQPPLSPCLHTDRITPPFVLSVFVEVSPPIEYSHDSSSDSASNPTAEYHPHGSSAQVAKSCRFTNSTPFTLMRYAPRLRAQHRIPNRIKASESSCGGSILKRCNFGNCNVFAAVALNNRNFIIFTY